MCGITGVAFASDGRVDRAREIMFSVIVISSAVVAIVEADFIWAARADAIWTGSSAS